MVSIDVPRNPTQRAGNIGRKQGRIITNVTPIYTVPANKKTRVTNIEMIHVTVGTDATAAIAIKRVGGAFDAISTFVAAVAPNNITTVNAVTLVAGEGISNVGDAEGTNHTVDIALTIEEFAA